MGVTLQTVLGDIGYAIGAARSAHGLPMTRIPGLVANPLSFG